MKFFMTIHLATLLLLLLAINEIRCQSSTAKPGASTKPAGGKPGASTAAGGGAGTMGTGTTMAGRAEGGGEGGAPEEPPSTTTTKKKSFGIKMNAEYMIVAMALGVSFTRL